MKALRNEVFELILDDDRGRDDPVIWCFRYITLGRFHEMNDLVTKLQQGDAVADTLLALLLMSFDGALYQGQIRGPEMLKQLTLDEATELAFRVIEANTPSMDLEKNSGSPSGSGTAPSVRDVPDGTSAPTPTNAGPGSSARDAGAADAATVTAAAG